MAERELVRTIDTEPLTAGEVILALFDVANELTPPEARTVLGHPEVDVAKQDVSARLGLLKIINAPLPIQQFLLPNIADMMKERYKSLGYTVEYGVDETLRIWKDEAA